MDMVERTDLRSALSLPIQSERIVLRELVLDDCTDRYVAWLQDTEVNQWLETRWSQQDLSSVREFVARVTADPNSALAAIVVRESQKHVGNIKIGPIDWVHKRAEISYFIGERDVWGLGLASEAIKLMTERALGSLGLERVQASLYEPNLGSARALEKAGFELEGTLRNALHIGGGARANQLIYGKLRPSAQSIEQGIDNVRRSI